MSSVFEEILTSSVGFVIAMVILVAAVAGGLYGYWVYANHATLENYLWPIAEVVPYKGEYFLGIVNTGHEPFTIKQIYLKGGAVITPGQAANPGLNWCSATNTELMHDQWWCGEVNQLPVAVMVCSALDPRVCSVVPVHGWQVVTFSQAAFGVGNGLIEVVVNDPLNAGWSVSWSYSGQSYSLSKSTSYTWYINPPYVPIQISFKASITQNPTGYTCQISPASVTATYSAGSVQQFTVTCTPAADIVIQDYYYGSFNQYGIYVCGDPVKYTINYWGNATGTLSGQVPCLGVNGQYSITYAIPTNGTVYWKLTSVSMHSGTTCIISPTSGSVNPGQVAIITFSCRYTPSSSSNYWVYVSVTGDSYGAGWKIASSAGSITGTGNVNDEQLYIGGPSDTLTASITSNPSGYSCTISPSSESVISGYHYSFTVSCQSTGGTSPPPGGNNYFVYVTVKNDTLGASWTISSSASSISGTNNVNNQQLKIGGKTDTLTAQITNNPSNYTCTISPSSTRVTNGSTYTFTVNCVKSGQSQPPPPKYYCIVTPSASDNVNGASGAYVSPSTTQYIPPGQSVIFTWAIQNNPVPPDYYFNNWVITLNGQTVKTDQTSSTYYDFQCSSTLSSNQTYTLSGTAYYWERYLQVGGGNTFNVNGNGTYPVTSQYTTAYFYWSDPLFISGSWNINYQQGGDTFTIYVQLNDVYSQSTAATPLTASTTLAIAGPPGYACTINSISPTQGSITSAKASNWLPTSATVNVTCVTQGKGW